MAKVTDIPASLPANGGNADTVGGYSASSLISTAVSQGLSWKTVFSGTIPLASQMLTIVPAGTNIPQCLLLAFKFRFIGATVKWQDYILAGNYWSLTATSGSVNIPILWTGERVQEGQANSKYLADETVTRLCICNSGHSLNSDSAYLNILGLTHNTNLTSLTSKISIDASRNLTYGGLTINNYDYSSNRGMGVIGGTLEFSMLYI